ncbi:MAG: HEAT repeat domain-containing protein, partial [Nitrospirota bacterium]
PAIEQEINEGKNFANLRQIYNALILATWYKQKLKVGRGRDLSLLGKVYVDQNKTKGIDTRDKEINQKIYDQYIESFKKGVYNFIKEDVDPATQEVIPRKYFSGGARLTYHPKKGSLILKTVGSLFVGALLAFGSPASVNARDLVAAATQGNKDGVTTEFVDNADWGDIGAAITVREGQSVQLALADQPMQTASVGTSFEDLVKDLKADPEPFNRMEAARNLGESHDPRAVDPLIQALGDEHSGVRINVATALGEIGDPRAVEPLIRRMLQEYKQGDTGFSVGFNAALALFKIGQPAVNPLVEALADKRGDDTFRKVINYAFKQALSMMMDRQKELKEIFQPLFVPESRTEDLRILEEEKSGEGNTIDIKKAYQWIKSQIHPKTGLVKSFPTVPEQDASYGVTWMYNQAQSIQDALAVGDLATAEQLVRSALKLKRNKGAWYNGYTTDSDEVATRIKEQGVSWTGPNMALGHGLLNVLERTADQKLAEEIIKATLDLARWLEGYSFDRGKYAYVSVGEGSGEVWTEHNERVFAFYYQLYNQFNNPRHKNKIVLEKYKNNANVQGFKLRADKIIRWIQTDKKEGGMWAGDHYLVGYKDLEGKELIPEITTALPKDHPDFWKRHAWGYPQYLGPIMASIAGLNPKDFAGGMDWLLARLSQFEIDGKIYKGVPRWLGTPSLWAKGTSETVVALQLLGREDEARVLLPTLGALQTENGGILAAVGDPAYGWPIHFPYESYEGISGALVGVGRFGPEFIADLELVKP